MILYEFALDCGRMGDLEGLFIADPKCLDPLFGKEIYFGEVLGKHSEVYETLTRGHVIVKSSDAEFVTKMADVLKLDISDGWATVSGFNPLDYYDPDDYDDEDDGSPSSVNVGGDV